MGDKGKLLIVGAAVLAAALVLQRLLGWAFGWGARHLLRLLHTLKDRQGEGMLSVNGHTGQV